MTIVSFVSIDDSSNILLHSSLIEDGHCDVRSESVMMYCTVLYRVKATLASPSIPEQYNPDFPEGLLYVMIKHFLTLLVVTIQELGAMRSCFPAHAATNAAPELEHFFAFGELVLTLEYSGVADNPVHV